MRQINVTLKKHIKASGLTQKQFAEKVGLREATVSQLANNKYDRIQLTHLLTIMDELGIEDFNELLTIEATETAGAESGRQLNES